MMYKQLLVLCILVPSYAYQYDPSLTTGTAFTPYPLFKEDTDTGDLSLENVNVVCEHGHLAATAKTWLVASGNAGSCAYDPKAGSPVYALKGCTADADAINQAFIPNIIPHLMNFYNLALKEDIADTTAGSLDWDTITVPFEASGGVDDTKVNLTTAPASLSSKAKYSKDSPGQEQFMKDHIDIQIFASGDTALEEPDSVQVCVDFTYHSKMLSAGGGRRRLIKSNKLKRRLMGEDSSMTCKRAISDCSKGVATTFFYKPAEGGMSKLAFKAGDSTYKKSSSCRTCHKWYSGVRRRLPSNLVLNENGEEVAATTTMDLKVERSVGGVETKAKGASLFKSVGACEYAETSCNNF